MAGKSMSLSLILCHFLAAVDLQQTNRTSTGACMDKLQQDQCFNYNDDSCYGIYTPWAKIHCALRCGYCKGMEPPCVNQIDNCDVFQKSDCLVYAKWARYTCRKFCNHCSVPRQTSYINEGGTIPVKSTRVHSTTIDKANFKTSTTENMAISTFKTIDLDCVDKLPQDQCFNYEDKNCYGVYTPWAKAHCALRCGYCKDMEPPCVDQVDNCNVYQKSDCETFKKWARYTCRKFCNKCTVPTQVEFINNTTIPATTQHITKPAITKTLTTPRTIVTTITPKSTVDVTTADTKSTVTTVTKLVNSTTVTNSTVTTVTEIVNTSFSCGQNVSECDWKSWSDWSDCVGQCGSSTRLRVRDICDQHGKGLVERLGHCNKTIDDAIDTQSCHVCSNGVYVEALQTCQCKIGYSGTCCDDLCADKIPNDYCFHYDEHYCFGDYSPWAMDNCAYRCGFCKELPCESNVGNCYWNSWGEWSQCDGQCGFASRLRTRGICCQGDKSFDECAIQCNKTLGASMDRQPCHLCNNGGIYMDKYSMCYCRYGYRGTCCGEYRNNTSH